jgi:hypothetical protein
VVFWTLQLSRYIRLLLTNCGLLDSSVVEVYVFWTLRSFVLRYFWWVNFWLISDILLLTGCGLLDSLCVSYFSMVLLRVRLGTCIPCRVEVTLLGLVSLDTMTSTALVTRFLTLTPLPFNLFRVDSRLLLRTFMLIALFLVLIHGFDFSLEL